MDLTTLAIAKKFSSNNSGSSGGGDSKILWFEITPSNPSDIYSGSSTPITIDISWNDLLEAYNNDFILIPYFKNDGNGVFFNLTMTLKQNNEETFCFSSITMIQNTLMFATLMIAEDSMMMVVQTISNGDGVSY